MEQNIEHMLTNIGLWLSSKQTTDFIIHSPEPKETRICRVNNFNYNAARDAIINYFNSLGTIDDIHYNHDEDSYEVWVYKNEPEDSNYPYNRLYIICYVKDCIIEV